eukprot:GHVH01015970.1.p1 GENE.GHVH01015970.1~~GHVH01015970.1.p1  ORF type:complete len:505 (+),score=70.56 GHVH01015970.1:31-1545(+)
MDLFQPQWGLWNEKLLELCAQKPLPCQLVNDCDFCRKAEEGVKKNENSNPYKVLKNRRIAYAYGVDDTSKQVPRTDVLNSYDPILEADPSKWISRISQGIGRKWSLDVLALEEYGADFPFLHIGYVLLVPLTVAKRTTTVRTLFNFLRVLNHAYNDVSYHNSTHAAQVAHHFNATLKLLGRLDHITTLERAIGVVSSLGHDAGHFGRSNQFIKMTGDPINHLYIDCPLEHYHAFLTFNSILAPHNNIFSTLSREQLQELHKKLVECILYTDLGRHFQVVKQFNRKLKSSIAEDCNLRNSVDEACNCKRCSSIIGFPSPKSGYDNVQDDTNLDEDLKWSIIKMALKLADIGHASLNWDQHYRWSTRAISEYYEESDEAVHFGFVNYSNFDRDDHHVFAQKQQSFIDEITIPIGLNLSMAAFSSSHKRNFDEICLYRMIQNQRQWEHYSDLVLDEFTHFKEWMKRDKIENANVLSAIQNIPKVGIYNLCVHIAFLRSSLSEHDPKV